MYPTTAALLNELTDVLETYSLWQEKPIDPSLLESTQPFCIDTLRFEQWLQFIFIPRMRALIDAKSDLPSNIALLPMAQVQWPSEYPQVHNVLAQIDSLLGDHE